MSFINNSNNSLNHIFLKFYGYDGKKNEFLTMIK